MTEPNSQPSPAQRDANQSDKFAPRVGFWQTPLAQNVLPFATSFCLHIGIIILMIVLLPAIVNRVQNSTPKREIDIPVASLPDGFPDGIANPYGPGTDPSRKAYQDTDFDQTVTEGPNDHRFAKIDEDGTGPGGGADGDNNFAIGPGHGAGRGHGVGGGVGDGYGLGNGNGGELAFGPRGGGGGPGRLFGGPGAHKIIFVCDGSGSMVGNKLEIVRQELMKEVNHLTAVKSFNVLIFHETADNKWMTMFSDHLEPATPAVQARLDDWVQDISANGETNPLKALDEAFREGPQMIFLLTDGEFDNAEGPNNDQVLAHVRELEKAAPKRVIISTRLFLKNDSEMKDVDKVSETLKTIAEENGGDFKVKMATDF